MQINLYILRADALQHTHHKNYLKGVPEIKWLKCTTPTSLITRTCAPVNISEK